MNTIKHMAPNKMSIKVLQLTLLALLVAGCQTPFISLPSSPTPTYKHDDILDAGPQINTVSTNKNETPLEQVPSSIPAYTDPRQHLTPGTYLAYWEDYEYRISVASLNTGFEKKTLILDHVLWPNFGLSPSGDELAYLNLDNQITIYNLRTGSSRVIPKFPNMTVTGDMEWSQDGKQILFVAVDSTEQFQSSTYIVSLDTSEITLLTPWRGTKVSPAWSPDNKWISFVSDHAKFSGEYPPRYAIYLLNTDCVKDPSSCFDKMISLADVVDGNAGNPCWSPDGKQIAFTYDLHGKYGIWLINPDGTNLSQIHSSDHPIGALSWSPNGEYIAFTSVTPSGDININDNSDVFVLAVAANGEGARNITGTPAGFEVVGFWLEIK